MSFDRRSAAVAGGVALLALLLAFAYGPGYAGYDAAWSLVWGSEVVHGSLPRYESPVAPTPHTLANAVAIPLAILGGETALIALTFLAFAVLIVAAGVTGARLFGLPTGLLAALLLATRPQLAREAAFASIDLPFLALVMCAAAVEASQPRAGPRVLMLLLLAGLLRPEAWVLSVLYAAYLGRPERATVALALGAPVLWMLSDLIVTGDPLFSFSGTRSLGEELSRATGLGTAIRSLDDAASDTIGGAVALAGLAGAAAALISPRRARTAIPLTVIAAGLATFLLFGALGLPVLARYLLAPGCMLAVLAGAPLPAPGTRPGPVLLTGTAAVAALLIAAVPITADGLSDARSFTHDRGRAHRDLRALAATPRFARSAKNCPTLRIPDFRTRPVLAGELNLSPERLDVGPAAEAGPGLLLTYADERTRYVFNLGAPGETPRQPAPAGTRLIAENRSWRAYASC